MLIISWSLAAQETEEGRKDRIWKVSIEGNKRFEDIVIKKYIATEQPSVWKRLTFLGRSGYQVSETEIRKDVIRIERFYQRRGYNDVEVSYQLESKRKEWRKHLTFFVTENIPIRIDSVEIQLTASPKDSAFISNNGDFTRSLRRSPYRKGRVYEPIEETEVIARFEQTLRGLGYPYSNTKVRAKTDSIAKKTDLIITTESGPRARFDSIFVEGEATLSKELIVRESGIKKGDYFSEADMREAQREVFKHHLFRLALVSIPDQPRDTTLNVLLRVKELPLRSVQLRLGSGDFDRVIEDDGRISGSNFYRLFRGQATWVYRNVRGKGEQFSTSGKLSFYDRKISAEYLFPYVYNTKSSVNINPYYQFRDERSYEILTAGIINTFGYEYNRNLTGSFSYQFAINNESNVRSTTEEVSIEQVLPDSLLSYNISSFSVNLYYSRNLQRGRRGLIVQPSLEFSGLFGESTFSFNKAALDIRKYSEINRNLVLATRVRGGAIYSARQDSLPSDVKFYVGGTNSVRGWTTQFLGPKRVVETISTEVNDGTEVSDTTLSYVPIGGRGLFNFNIEFRQRLHGLMKGFGIAVFLDGGQVWRRMSDVDLKNVQFGIGGGLRYESPIGPIRVDVGYKINPNEQDLRQFPGGIDRGGRFARWDIHLTIGQAF
ncbi:MAG: outer membrane protein assembly factor [Balneola sp.]